MTRHLNEGVARIWHAEKDIIVGAGFLVSPGHVMTCAHVVNATLEGRKSFKSSCPEATIRLDFPITGTVKIPVCVVEWRLPEIDAAVLQLKAPCPADLQRRELAVLDDVAGHRFQAFGFPTGFPDGRNESGVIEGVIGGGRLEVRRTDSHKYFVTQGFSGAPAFLAETQQIVGMVVATGPVPEDRLAYLIPATQLEQAWPPLAKPYRGLFPFDEADARWFRGRSAFVQRLIERVAEKPVVAVVGASGSGKSSVVRAGLVPELRRAGGWRVAAFRPDRRPLFELALALAPLLDPNGSPATRLKTAHDWAGEIASDPAVIHDVARMLLENARGSDRLLLIADQFEELFTLVNDQAERDRFVEVLTQLRRQQAPVPIRLVLTMRADFSGRTFEDRRLIDLFQDAEEKLGPMLASSRRTETRRPVRKLPTSCTKRYCGNGLAWSGGLTKIAIFWLGSNAPKPERVIGTAPSKSAARC